MRRLKIAPPAPGHLELAELPERQRLFVQRWMELFDWAADVHFQVRPEFLTEVEAEVAAAKGFHVPLLKAEIQELRKAQSFAVAMVEANPVEAAERLSVTPSALLHHPQYLFHDVNTLLSAPPAEFSERVAKLRDSWAASAMQEYALYFAVRKLRALPVLKTDAQIKLLSKDAIPSEVRSVAPDLFSLTGGPNDGPVPVFEIAATARDTNSAIEDALRAYRNYSACVRAATSRLDPSLLILDATVVRLPTNPPVWKRLPVQKRRFQMREKTHPKLFEQLDALTVLSPVAATFLRNFAEANERLREGDIDSALEALVLNQDLAFYGCQGHNWGHPHYLVELGSKLIALDWPRRYFSYIESYARTPSYAVAPLPKVDDPKRAQTLLLAGKAWPLLTNSAAWKRLMARSAWDALLDYRRSHFIKILNDLPATLERVRMVASWDLARAVRARNTLVHQGGYLRHHRLIGVLFDVYELVLRMRLAGLARRPMDPDAGFVQLGHQIEKDFQDLSDGTYRSQSLESLCNDGWGYLWSTK